MRILMIGAVAGATSAAAQARRQDKDAEIVIYEMGFDISYSGCGMPYYIGDLVKDIHALEPRDPAFFKRKYDVDIFINHEVLSIDPKTKTLQIMDKVNQVILEDHYDKLVISTGALPFHPPITGINGKHVFFLRDIQDAVHIKHFIESYHPKTAVVIGSGAIGFEMLENFILQGIDVTIVEVKNKVAPNLDDDMAEHLESLLREKKVKIFKSTTVEQIKGKEVLISGGHTLPADLVLVATGVRPNVVLAQEAGIELGAGGSIKVNKHLQTNFPDIYACGDCAEGYSRITGKPYYRPLASTANKMGRIVGDNLTGGNTEYKGSLSTGIYQVFDLAITSTGMSEQEAAKEGLEPVSTVLNTENKPRYMHGEPMRIKLIAAKADGRLIGAQIVGTKGVDKRIDVFAALISYGAKVDEVMQLDLAYAPPFATTMDPVHYAGMFLENEWKKEK